MHDKRAKAQAAATATRLSIVPQISPGAHEAAVVHRAGLDAALITHFGSIGILFARGIVMRTGQAQGAARTIHYRRTSGAELSIDIPGHIPVIPNDFIIVRSLALPDGVVSPLMIRLAGQPGWIMLCDVDAIIERYAAGAHRFIRWSAGAGGALACLAVLGIAPPIAATAAAVSLAGAWRMRCRHRRDRLKICRWLARRSMP